MAMEIAIHRNLQHKHVVGFHGFFEDDNNVYVVLELCRRRSLMELHKRRRAITEPETRYFMNQIVLGVQYMHNIKVIHRDLKLGNLFIDDEMNIKIGDFGLATREEFEGERKRTLCGTPNYIAPEVLSKKGHSFEVDTWSLGCIMYTLLVGKPPFETTSLKETYQKIRSNDYYIPSNVSTPARTLISRLLQKDPAKRPDMTTILKDDFFTSGYLPPKLPTSCLTTTPRFAPTASRAPLSEVKGNKENKAPESESQKHNGKHLGKSDGTQKGAVAKVEQAKNIDTECGFYNLPDMMQQLTEAIESRPLEKSSRLFDEAEDPAAVPVFWISKWVDYSDKYGLGYQLCDGSVGVLFNDSTRLLLHQNQENIEYIDRDWNEFSHTLSSYPLNLEKKVTLLKYFRNYMSEHLVKTGAAMTPRESDDIARLPFMTAWFRTTNAIVLHLSNGTMQVNFFLDHTKIIVCPLMGAITYIDSKRESRTFRLELIKQYGCTRDLYSRIKYGLKMVERLTAARSQPSKQKSKPPLQAVQPYHPNQQQTCQ